MKRREPRQPGPLPLRHHHMRRDIVGSETRGRQRRRKGSVAALVGGSSAAAAVEISRKIGAVLAGAVGAGRDKPVEKVFVGAADFGMKASAALSKRIAFFRNTC